MTRPDGPLGWITDALEDLDRRDLRRHLRHHLGPPGPWLTLDTPSGPRRLLHLCSNNYLGLADDPRLAAAAAEAAGRHGVGTGASRLVTGGTPVHRDLEYGLAEFKEQQDAVLLSSGYLANLAILTALAGRGDTIVSDERNHASIIDACRLAGAETRVYRHADAEHAEELLRDAPGRRVLVTDGVFSMDGNLAPLPALCDAAERHEAAVVVDDAHGTGVVGPDGRGTAAHFDCQERVSAIVVTLSKALGSAGGAIVGSSDMVDWVRNRARPFIFDTALPAPSAASALTALQISVDEPDLRARAVAGARSLAQVATAAGHPVATPDAAIVPIIIGGNGPTLEAMQALVDEGVLAVAIRPPSVAEGAARLRLTTMASHSDEDLDFAAAALQRSLSHRRQPDPSVA